MELKITKLKAATCAAYAELTAANNVDRTGNAPRTNAALRACDAAEAAEDVERRKANALKAKFHKRGDTTCGSGLCNAGDTFGGHIDSEYSTEYWQCAIDSVQMMIDCAGAKLEKDVK